MQPKTTFNISRVRHSKSLFLLSVASAVAALALLPLWVLDERVVDGVSAWEKPLKFMISSVIFALTYSWLSSFINVGMRAVKIAGLVIAVSLSIELILITGLAASGETSHFNVSSPFAITVWSLMATFISIVLIATVFLSLFLIRDKSQEANFRLGLGLGSFNTAIGMGLAFLMTSPTANQLADFQGVAGAHSVGVSDGGPGLPFLGWSTVAGDLRVGHFFGLHSIQVAALLLAATFLLPIFLRKPLLIVGNVTYLGFVGLVTWQALRAEPFSDPGPLTLTSFVVLLGLSAVGFLLTGTMKSGSRPASRERLGAS